MSTRACTGRRLKAVLLAVVFTLASLHPGNAQENLAIQPAGEVVLPGDGSIIVQNFTQSLWDFASYKRNVFEGLSRKSARRYALSAESRADRLAYRMLFATRSTVPDNLTDLDLAYLGQNPRRLIQRASAPIQAISGKELTNLTNYSPVQVANLVTACAVSWYQVLPKPAGAFNTTWASESLWQACKDIRIATFAKRSVLVRLLGDEHIVNVPTNTLLYFTWSGLPSIPIELGQPAWRKSDIPSLQRLLVSPAYAGMAQRRLDLLSAAVR